MRFLDRVRVVAGVVELVVTALEARPVGRHHQPHDLDAFFKPLRALLDPGKRNAQFLVLRLVPGRPHSDLEPPVGDVIDGDRLRRQDGRVPVGDPRDQDAKPDPRSLCGQPREQRPAFHARPVRVAVERLEVIEDPGPIEAGLLGELHSFQQFRPQELMLRDV